MCVRSSWNQGPCSLFHIQQYSLRALQFFLAQVPGNVEVRDIYRYKEV